MLHAVNDLKGLNLDAKDGYVGTVEDLYFDDQDWTIRYLVDSTGSWLSGRRVLISPHSLGKPDKVKKIIPVSLSRGQVQSAPSPETDKPVSRQFERMHYGYYGYPYYWSGPYVWGGSVLPYYQFAVGIPGPAPVLQDQARKTKRDPDNDESGDPHLRSASEVRGYYVEAVDGEVGHIEDFLIDEEDWTIRYLIIDTRNWLPGKHVAVPVDWAKDVRWEDRKVSFGHLKDEIRNAPEYSGTGYLTPEYSRALDSYYETTERKT